MPVSHKAGTPHLLSLNLQLRPQTPTLLFFSVLVRKEQHLNAKVKSDDLGWEGSLPQKQSSECLVHKAALLYPTSIHKLKLEFWTQCPDSWDSAYQVQLPAK
jgi:hypothetical protein